MGVQKGQVLDACISLLITKHIIIDDCEKDKGEK